MKTNQFNGKAIYQPKGKAAEYSEWAFMEGVLEVEPSTKIYFKDSL